MSPAERLLSRADYVENGRPGTWPGGEDASVRADYDRLLAQQGTPSTRKTDR